MKKYNRIFKEQEISNNEIIDKIIEYFTNNPNPSDGDIHNLANTLTLDPSLLEEIIYKLLGSFLGYGKSKEYTGTYNENELKLGIIVEMEHTNNEKIAERIAKDHLAERDDYYTFGRSKEIFDEI